jgi:hypothetical protein
LNKGTVIWPRSTFRRIGSAKFHPAFYFLSPQLVKQNKKKQQQQQNKNRKTNKTKTNKKTLPNSYFVGRGKGAK